MKAVIAFANTANRIADTEMLEALRLFTKKISFDEIPYAPAKTNVLDWQAIKAVFKQRVNKNITEQKVAITID